MNRIPCILILFFGLLTQACTEKEQLKIDTSDYLIFGFKNGFCQGDQCSAYYKLDSETLYKVRPAQEFDDPHDFSYEGMTAAEFALAKDLLAAFPEKLLEEQETTLGCPDCYDQGTLIIAYQREGTEYFWRVDTNKNAIPEYLHDFVDQMNETIDALK